MEGFIKTYFRDTENVSFLTDLRSIQVKESVEWKDFDLEQKQIHTWNFTGSWKWKEDQNLALSSKQLTPMELYFMSQTTEMLILLHFSWKTEG